MKTKNSKFILGLNFGQINLGIIYLITLTEISLVLIIVVVFALIFFKCCVYAYVLHQSLRAVFVDYELWLGLHTPPMPHLTASKRMKSLQIKRCCALIQRYIFHL